MYVIIIAKEKDMAGLLLSTWNDFAEIFVGEYAWLTITLMVLGIILCIIEAVIPGFGFFGIAGILCEVGAVLVHAFLCNGIEHPLQILILIVMIVLVVLLIFLLFVRSARFGLLGKTPIVENNTAIPKDYGQKDQDKLKSYIGKEAITLTECKPLGKIRICDEIIEVSTKGGLISKGEVVKIVAVEDNVVYISKLTY